MPHSFEHYNSIFFVLGLLVVAAYGCQRFNEPSFPNKDTLPHTVDPLRYLFLKRSYRKAIFAYIAASLLLYSALVLPGPSIVPMLFANEKFPPECWALLVALFLVGVVPNSRLPWLIVIEERLRRLVHAWFLVPGGTVR